MKPTLLILAAGMGSRYGGLKQLDGVGPNHEAIIEYSIFDAIRAGFGRVVFVIRKDIEDVFKEKIGSQFEGKIKVDYVFQELDTPFEGINQFPPREKPWGTAHAMLVAHDTINEPFAVINADDYYGVSAYTDMVKFLTETCSPDHHAMAGYVLDNTLSDHGEVNRGICEMNEDNLLIDVVERLKIRRNEEGVAEYLEDDKRFPIPDGTLVSMNFWGFHPAIFEEIRKEFVKFVEANKDNPRAEFFIPLFVNDFIKSGKIKVSVLPCEDNWYGVTYREDKEMVQQAFAKLIANGVYKKDLW
jgi:NDP-sugar pyrophosphorylase family protein